MTKWRVVVLVFLNSDLYAEERKRSLSLQKGPFVGRASQSRKLASKPSASSTGAGKETTTHSRSGKAAHQGRPHAGAIYSAEDLTQNSQWDAHFSFMKETWVFNAHSHFLESHVNTEMDTAWAVFPVVDNKTVINVESQGLIQSEWCCI